MKKGGDCMSNYAHSVELIESKCIGCTDCVKRCPTQAIRVRNGKAVINESKCIDCGVCIKVCSHYAKKAVTSSYIKVIKSPKYKVAIPAPALYSQFKKIRDVNLILTAIKQIGFDEVFEVSYAAEMVTEATKQLIAEKKLKRPVISSACPAVVKLISMRFPSLLENVLPVIAPVEVAAIAAKNYLVAKGLKREDISVFFISPCAAKNTYAINPLGIEKSEIEGVISIRDIYMPLLHKISTIKTPEKLVQSSSHGVGWAATGGETKGVNTENAISVDGVENVEKLLEEVENGQFSDCEFIEALACVCGCLGGPLTVANSFAAKVRLAQIGHELNKMPESNKRNIIFEKENINFMFTKPLQKISSAKLDDNIAVAFEKLERMEKIYEKLPHIDCSSCGAPTCKALAEDIVQNEANIEDCIFMLRMKVKELAEAMYDLSSKLPQTLNNSNN